jgi:hypothetical protein
MFPGSLMMGAKERLLPPSLPYRFFVAAILFHISAWACLLAADADALSFMGGQGLVLAALHMITLGTLAMTAMGAAIQLLPVATRRPLGPLWAIRLMFWLYAPGVAVLASGFALALPAAQHLGATLAAAGLGVFVWLVSANQRQVSDLPGVTRHVWMSMASLVLLAVFGLVLIVDFTKGFLPDHGAIAAAHAVLAGYGFMGMLAFGFSTVLIPMFILGPSVPDNLAKRSALGSGLALAVAVTGTVMGNGSVAASGAVLGLVAVGLLAHAMRDTVKKRMKKRFEPFFRLVWVALAMLPLSILAGLALALGAPADPFATLWGFLLIFGWLLTFVTALMQRIMPFLASMHSSSLGGKPALLSHLASKPLADLHLACHLAALILVAAAILGGWVWPLRLGLAAGLTGSVVFGAFTVEVIRRYRSHMQAAAAAHIEG